MDACNDHVCCDQCSSKVCSAGALKMSEAQIKEQIFQQAALRLFSLQQSFARNRQNKTRLAYQSGALEALELLIKELLLEEEYEEWRKTWKTKQSI